MAKDKRSRDQKRKDKKAKQAGKTRKGESLAYSGDKYKAGDLAAFWMETEVAIYELYVISGRTLLDRTVYSSVETLVKKLRAKTLPLLSEDKVTFDRSREDDLQYEADFLIDHIRHRWKAYSEAKSSPPVSDCVGVLRTILGTIELKKSREPQSQKYLKYIAEFLTKKAGVRVNLPPDEDSPEEEEEPLPTFGNLRAGME